MDWKEEAQEKLELTEQELDEAIEEKKEEYDQLVSDDHSAAILVAKDHNVEIASKDTEEPIELQNLVPEMQNVTLKATVIEVDDTHQFDGGQVRSVIIDDGTNQTQVSFWDEDADTAGNLELEDKLLVEGGYTNKEEKYEDSYCENMYGVPGVQIGDSTSVEVIRGEEKAEVV